MQPASMEVQLRLIALGDTKKECEDRTIVLTDKTPSVDVGRASTNPLKGLGAAQDNAMISSPIMSRQHARFTMTKEPEQGVKLQDLGSTHGTFLGGRRLDRDAPYQLNTGENVTFGTKVTNGPSEHAPKNFQVLFKCTDPRNIQHGQTRTTNFNGRCVSEPDESSDDSREASVEIMSTKGRTYSVPSSGDEDSYDSEEDENPMVEGKEDRKSSAATTPESKCSKYGSQPKNSSINKLLNSEIQEGSSQQNPIEIDGIPTAVSYNVLDSDSEAEDSENYEPEDAEPASPKVPLSLQTPSLPKISFPKIQSPPAPPQNPPSALSAILNQDPENAPVTTRVIPETQDAGMPNTEKTSLHKAAASESEREESEQEDDNFDDDDMIVEINSPSARKQNIQSEISTDAAKSSRLTPFPVQRAPSPSDAALAKRGTSAWDRPADYQPYAYYGPANVAPGFGSSQLGYSHQHHNFPYPPPPSNQSLNSSTSPYSLYPRYYCAPAANYPFGSDTAGMDDDEWAMHTSVASNCGSTKASEAGAATQGNADAIRNPRLNIANLVQQTDDGNKKTETLNEDRPLKRKADDISSDALQVLSAKAVQESSGKPSIEPDNTDAFKGGPAARLGQQLPGLLEALSSPKPTYTEYDPPLSPVYSPTSPQWHTSSPPYSPRSPSMDIGSPFWKHGGSGSNSPLYRLSTPSGERATSPGNDASRPVLDPQKDVLVSKYHEELYELHAPEPVIIATTETTAAEKAEEPARKKAKTSSFRVGGFAKFMSGVAAGAVGAIGMVAAIIATTPDSVKEEVMREMGAL